MPKGLQHKGIVRRNKMIYAAVKLFLENGYEKTTTASIAKAAGMSPSSLENKLRRLLKCCFTLYKVPEAKQEEVIGQILKMDLKPIAEKIIEDTVRKAEEGFEAVLAEK